MWNLFKCNCWLIIEVILRNLRCNNKVYSKLTFRHVLIVCIGLGGTDMYSFTTNSDKTGHFKFDKIHCCAQ